MRNIVKAILLAATLVAAFCTAILNFLDSTSRATAPA